MPSISIRPYQPADESQLVSLWNQVMSYDLITPAGFRAQLLLDPNLDPQGFPVAESEGRVIGYLLSLVRRVPLLGSSLEPAKGWITAFGVHPAWQRRGVGSRLLTRAFECFQSLGRQVILVSPYTPNYFIPGVDVNAALPP